MKIETKFNIGDEAWLMYYNKPTIRKIHEIRVYIEEDKIEEVYLLEQANEEDDACYLDYDSEDLFKSKKELIDSL